MADSEDKQAYTISVIVTFYNLADCVSYCVESLLHQSYSLPFEIVLIDDGSTDGTLEALKKYEHNPNVRVFTKPNGGTSDARNYGVEHASGDAIVFMDGDDFASPYYLQTLADAYAIGCDMALARQLVVSANARWDNIDWQSGAKATPLSQGDAIDLLLKGEIGEGPYCKLASRQLFIDHPFPVGKRYEDVALAGELFLACSSFAYVDTPVYGYVVREGSVVHSSNPPFSQAEDFMWAIDRFLKPIEVAYPEKRELISYRFALEYVRVHALLKRMDQRDERVKSLDKTVLSQAQALRKDFTNNPDIAKADKLRFLLLGISPALHDAALALYERCLKGR